MVRYSPKLNRFLSSQYLLLAKLLLSTFKLICTTEAAHWWYCAYLKFHKHNECNFWSPRRWFMYMPHWIRMQLPKSVKKTNYYLAEQFNQKRNGNNNHKWQSKSSRCIPHGPRFLQAISARSDMFKHNWSHRHNLRHTIYRVYLCILHLAPMQ